MNITKSQVLHTNKIQADIIGELKAKNASLTLALEQAAKLSEESLQRYAKLAQEAIDLKVKSVAAERELAELIEQHEGMERANVQNRLVKESAERRLAEALGREAKLREALRAAQNGLLAVVDTVERYDKEIGGAPATRKFVRDGLEAVDAALSSDDKAKED